MIMHLNNNENINSSTLTRSHSGDDKTSWARAGTGTQVTSVLSA